MVIEVRVERARCIGAGSCVRRAPQVFQLDDSDIAMVVGRPEDEGPDGEAAVLDAAEQCPTLAISIFRNGERLN